MKFEKIIRVVHYDPLDEPQPSCELKLVNGMQVEGDFSPDGTYCFDERGDIKLPIRKVGHIFRITHIETKDTIL